MVYLREKGSVTLGEGEGVVLAPSMYWYAHAAFPGVSLRKAKAMADAYLKPRPERYDTLFVARRGEGYDCYAYDAEALMKRLAREGLAGQPVWFLQQWIDCVPFRLDESRAAVALNGIVLEMPGAEAPSLPGRAGCVAPRPFMQKGKEGGNGTRLLKTAIAVSAVAMVLDFAAAFQEKAALASRLQTWRSERTTYEIKAMIGSYEKMKKREETLREHLGRALAGRTVKSVTCTAKGCKSE
ncbi:MAG: hypothetical protein GXO33_05735 [Epsilonproteobacteria bacterium]|nr:hypothetical protein [Campylobacterota bacterium]